MTDILHPNIIDHLALLPTLATQICICQGEPLNLTDCTSDLDSGGKRVTTEETLAIGDITLTDGINAQSRKLNVPSKIFDNGVTVAVAGSPDLWISVYDGTRLLYRSNQIIDRDLPLSATITSPVLEYEIRQ